MNRSATLRRRRFLQVAATAAASGAAVSCGGRKSPWRFFTIEEAGILTALCERIIPTDQEPGAAWAGVVNFIDRHLTGHYKRFQETYRQGLACVEQTSQALFGKRFLELGGEQQTEILRVLESDQAPREIWMQVPAKQFFDLVVAHTMQGYYGDPRHGGNRDAVSWKVIGVPLVPIRGRDQYDLSKPGLPDQFLRREKWARNM
jgi:gluconate 2-dehydrogenase gamma chain